MDGSVRSDEYSVTEGQYTQVKTLPFFLRSLINRSAEGHVVLIRRQHPQLHNRVTSELIRSAQRYRERSLARLGVLCVVIESNISSSADID